MYLDSITLMGKADLVEKVTSLLDEKRKVWEANAEDRRLRNYTETIEVEPIFHSKIIGVKVKYFWSYLLSVYSVNLKIWYFCTQTLKT